MKIKPYKLEDYKKNKEEIKRLEERYQELFTKATNIVQSYNDNPKPANRSGPHGIEREVIQLLDITNKIDRLKRINLEIELNIRRLPYKERIVLYNNIVLDKSLVDIAKEIKKSYRHVQKIKAKSLMLYNETIKNAILT